MTDTETTIETDVAIIGGGPVGLAASLLLARHGIRSVVLEKHATTAMHPKASAFNTRTMEILRQLGIADDVYANTGPVGGVSFYTSLTGYKLGEISMQDAPGYLDSLLASTPSPLTPNPPTNVSPKYNGVLPGKNTTPFWLASGCTVPAP